MNSTIKVFEYEYKYADRLFDKVAGSCPDGSLLLGNYPLQNCKADALLFCSGGIVAMVFKECQGWCVEVSAKKPWTENATVIPGDYGGRNPFMQASALRSDAASLSISIGLGSVPVRVLVLFSCECRVAATDSFATAAPWFDICTPATLPAVLASISEKQAGILSPETIEAMAGRLHLDNTKSRVGSINAAYVPDVATDFYSRLEYALTLSETDTSKAYAVMSDTVHLAVDQKIKQCTLAFAGFFSKVDYLAKEAGIEGHGLIDIYEACARLRQMGDAAADNAGEDFCDFFLYDLRAFCRFIAKTYSIDIPPSLSAKLPGDAMPRRRQQRLDEMSVRVTVDSWSEDEITVTRSDNGMPLKVKLIDPERERDWTYITKLISRGSQLNIVNGRKGGEAVIPDQLVYEPDLLVDISSIAACFESYATSPYVYLINKIKPNIPTKPMLLGLFSGQLLDEAVNLGQPLPYGESVRRFFAQNALSILACGELGDFHDEAKLQKNNIGAALEKMKAGIKSFDRNRLILEPSFFCEMLGLQGRMDFLQLDYEVLVEQKSGKGAFASGYSDPATPLKQEKHYVQLILYMALLRYNFSMPNSDISAFLLYSKYSNGLLKLGAAPKLLHEAMKLRNEIAWGEMFYSREGFGLLAKLTPDMLNEKCSGTLWDKYVKPQLSKLLAPFASASEVERAYCFRFLKFVETEHLLAKIGNKTKENSGFAATWNDSLEEKVRAGNIYDELTLSMPAEAPVAEVCLNFSKTVDTDTSNFRHGDIVIFYPYARNAVPDARKTIVFRATLCHIGGDSLRLRLRTPQGGLQVFAMHDDDYWAVEHDFLESSSNSQYRGMAAFLSAPQERKDLLLSIRPPRIDSSENLVGDYGSFNELVLHAKRAKDFFLILGPPGTGKTSHGIVNILKEQLLSPHGGNVLLLAYTNRAVDEICDNLMENGIDFLRIGAELSCAERFRPHLLSSRVEGAGGKGGLQDMVDNSRVVCATTASLNSSISLLSLKTFALAIVDEASQILEPHIVGLLSATNGNKLSIEKFILIGDNKQLPAVVAQLPAESFVADPILRKHGITDCRRSLFERLLSRHRNDPSLCYMLTRQGRMHRDISLFPNYAFYQNALHTVPLDHQEKVLPVAGNSSNGIDNILLTRRIAFIASPQCRESKSDKANPIEASMIAATLSRVYALYGKERFDANGSVGVIVPYRNQISTVRKAVAKLGIKALENITIDTVERYQGSQRDVIIYGFTISRRHQLDFLTSNVFDEEGAVIDPKLNVAMTRAREHLLLIGNPALLAENFIFANLMAYVKLNGGYFDIPADSYCKGQFEVGVAVPMPGDMPAAGLGDLEALLQKVVEPEIKANALTDYPRTIFGNEANANLELIGYGHAGFDGTISTFPDAKGVGKTEFSPRWQVLLYCHYLMGQSFAASLAAYAGSKSFARAVADAKRVCFVDMGCGPATASLAFGAAMRGVGGGECRYLCVDTSAAMIAMCRRLLVENGVEERRCTFAEKIPAAGSGYWQSVSEMPSLVVFNFSSFFASTGKQDGERVAMLIRRIAKAYPLNRYLVVVSQPTPDYASGAYQVFAKQLLGEGAELIDSGQYESNPGSPAAMLYPQYNHEVWQLGS